MSFIFMMLFFVTSSWGGDSLTISSIGTKHVKEVESHGMIPRGSALLTPSGDLNSKGITTIIHAAPGSMTKSGAEFDPTLDGLKLSIKNALMLAEKNKVKCLAMPFIGGGIFLHAFKMSKPQLADFIISSIAEADSGVKVVIVTWGEEDQKIFQKVLTPERQRKLLRLTLASGSITEFSTHLCDSIVNAANMEVVFGGGLSGIIGKATGQAQKINAIASELIKLYYK